MQKGWYQRLVAAIREDGRPLKEISIAARCGENYVQQMLKDGKQPGTDRFVRLLKVLGRASSLHVILGTEMTPEDEELIRVVSSLSDDQKRAALTFFRAQRAPSQKQARAS